MRRSDLTVAAGRHNVGPRPVRSSDDMFRRDLPTPPLRSYLSITASVGVDTPIRPPRASASRDTGLGSGSPVRHSRAVKSGGKGLFAAEQNARQQRIAK